MLASPPQFQQSSGLHQDCNRFQQSSRCNHLCGQGRNLSDTPRYAQYISMSPAPTDEEKYKEQAEANRSGARPCVADAPGRAIGGPGRVVTCVAEWANTLACYDALHCPLARIRARGIHQAFQSDLQRDRRRVRLLLPLLLLLLLLSKHTLSGTRDTASASVAARALEGREGGAGPPL